MLDLIHSLTQETRLLRLFTPLGDDVLVAECLRAEEGIGQPYRLTLSALSSDAGIRLKRLIGQPVLLQLLTSRAGDWRPFHGHVLAARGVGADGGLARYELEIGPWYAFLGAGRDSRVFQDKTVFDILDAVFGAWQDPGRLAPAWRYEIADREVYPKRSLTCQYQESSLAFAERLMLEEGLFYWFEHTGDPGGGAFGSHTMVIADHNGAFQPNAQPQVRFTQPGAVMREDSMDRWRTETRFIAGGVELGSWDYRSRSTRPVAASTANAGAGTEAPMLRDAPGAYAYASREQGQRIADRQAEALDASREVHIGAGTVRTLAPGTTFTLEGHARLDAGDAGEREFAVLRVLHLAHNNLEAKAQDAVRQALGPGALAQAIGAELRRSLHATGTEQGERPLYRNRIDAIPRSLPYRSSAVDGHGVLLRPKPSVRGQQTAVVVGPPGAVIHTDRDHRIKVQFHWQRGDQSHSRLSHPAPDGHTGAPGDDGAGTWVRVATSLAPVAGANWGSVAVPRVGSEVLVDFIDGDIDRPVVIGAVYNGRGQGDAQHNQVAHSAGSATGNAPAWFPGEAGAHAHAAVLSGIKSQAMAASQDGAGPYSQLVFDDSPGEPRVALQRHADPHAGTDELNLGHLRHQTDNQRLATSGFGAELKSAHGIALRAGAGMLLSADARTGGSGAHLDSREAASEIGQAHELQLSLAQTAQKQNAMLKDAKGAPEPKPEELPALVHMAASARTVEATRAGGAAVDGGSGGAGLATAYTDAHLQVSAPRGIAALTPASAMLHAGTSTSLTTGDALNFAAQGNLHQVVASGISLFTYGKVGSNKSAPNQETGLRLHAASGKLSIQSQSDQSSLVADKRVTVASVEQSVNVAALEHVLLTAQGAYLKLEGGNIMLHGPGRIEFKASVKELTGPASSAPVLPSFPQTQLKLVPRKGFPFSI